MDEQPRADTAAEPEVDPGTPRWVKVVGVVTVLLIAAVALVLLLGGGEHGPGRHAPGGDSGGHTAPADSHAE